MVTFLLIAIHWQHSCSRWRFMTGNIFCGRWRSIGDATIVDNSKPLRHVAIGDHHIIAAGFRMRLRPSDCHPIL